MVDGTLQSTSIQATPELINDPQAFHDSRRRGRAFRCAVRLLVVAETSATQIDVNFRELQAQLEGTENRIRSRETLHQGCPGDNTTTRQFPTNLTAMMFGPQAEAAVHGGERARDPDAPTVDFGSSAPTRDRAASPRPAPPPGSSGEYPGSRQVARDVYRAAGGVRRRFYL